MGAEIQTTQPSGRSFGFGILSLSIAVTVVANAVANCLPVLLTILGRTRGVTESQGGLYAMAVLGGIAIGSFGAALMPKLLSEIGWRRITVIGLSLEIVTLLLSMSDYGFPVFFVLGLFGGIGAGIANAVLYSIIAEGESGTSLAAWFAAGQLGLTAIGMKILPAVADRFGDSSLFACLAALGSIALVLCNWLPSGPKARELLSSDIEPIIPHATISPAGWLTILALFCYYCGSGAVYTFLAYMGVAWGGEVHAVEEAVSNVLLVSMGATLVAGLIGARLKVGWAAYVALMATLVAISLFIAFQPVGAFFAVASFFYFAVNLTSPFLFGFLVHIDRSSGAAMMMGAALQGGMAFGAAISGYMITPDYVLFNAVSFALCAFALVLMLIAQRIRRSAVLAEI